MNCHLRFDSAHSGSLRALILNLILAFACHLQAQSEPDYFPMHVGDTWTYKLTTGGGATHWANQTIRIADTTIIQQKKYFVFEDKIYDLYYEPGKVYHNVHYYRKFDSGDVMKFNHLANDEQLYYTFQSDSLYKPYLYYGELGLDKKWQISYIHANATLSIPLGIFSQCYAYRFEVKRDSSNHVTPLEIRYLAPNIGLLEVTAEGDDNFLTGACVNGILLGDTTLTSVEEIALVNIPEHPVLFPNFPNPFNHTTHLKYYLPETWTQPVQVSVFDVSGREIMTFVREKSFRGPHEIIWTGKNNHGREVSSGLYIVRLTCGDFLQSIKINYLGKEGKK
ncbi:T9SS type A sorting domain-containing protein [bacterium]|nr:T9SS type A sorting domain-containing protein [bacterium]